MLTSLGALKPEANDARVAHESWLGEMDQGINYQFGALPHRLRLVTEEDSTRMNCRIKKVEPVNTMSERPLLISTLLPVSAVKAFLQVKEVL